jgi:hypothetical protein
MSNVGFPGHTWLLVVCVITLGLGFIKDKHSGFVSPLYIAVGKIKRVC